MTDPSHYPRAHVHRLIESLSQKTNDALRAKDEELDAVHTAHAAALDARVHAFQKLKKKFVKLERENEELRRGRGLLVLQRGKGQASGRGAATTTTPGRAQEDSFADDEDDYAVTPLNSKRKAAAPRPDAVPLSGGAGKPIPLKRYREHAFENMAIPRAPASLAALGFAIVPLIRVDSATGLHAVGDPLRVHPAIVESLWRSLHEARAKVKDLSRRREAGNPFKPHAGKCAWNEAFMYQTSWSPEGPGVFCCKTCHNKKRACLFFNEDGGAGGEGCWEILPLPPAARPKKGRAYSDAEFYVNQYAMNSGQAEMKGVWSAGAWRAPPPPETSVETRGSVGEVGGEDVEGEGIAAEVEGGGHDGFAMEGLEDEELVVD